jgi:hypothetical protein
MLAPLTLCFQKEAHSKRCCYVKEAALVAASFIKTVSLLRIAIFAPGRCWIFAAHNERVARALKFASANIKLRQWINA